MAQVKAIKLTEIATSPLNPRKTFDEGELQELAASIAQNGLVQAITLRKKKGENGEKYEIVCGERRYRAHLILGVETIEAVVKDLDDKQAFACMVIENLQRKDVDPMEEAASLRHLFAKCDVPVKEIAKMLGKSVSFVANRIQLNNIIDGFVTLMRAGTLGLNHLQEIAKLTHEQQESLLSLCFQPANIERWHFKTLKMEMLRQWIDETVMGAISAAKFDPYDETYKTCKACKGCKLNTASFPARFAGQEARCMKMELYRAKNQEAVIRKAKESGLMVIYSGSPQENADIIKAAEELLVTPLPLGSREYLICPTPPAEDSTADPEKQARRMANYERIKAVFDENVSSGIVIKVYELCHKGVVTGEVRYLYNLQASDAGVVDGMREAQAARLTQLKADLRNASDKKEEAKVERQRAFMEESKQYADLQTDLGTMEDNIFLALLASRLPGDSRKAIGLAFDGTENVEETFATLQSARPRIFREFIRVMLADKSVGYSTAFSAMLDMVMRDQFSTEAQDIDSQLTTDYEKKCREYEEHIAVLEKELAEARGEVSDGDGEETTEEAEESQEEAPAPTENEAEPVTEEVA